jgi:hypothetical protein
MGRTFVQARAMHEPVFIRICVLIISATPKN